MFSEHVSAERFRLRSKTSNKDIPVLEFDAADKINVGGGALGLETLNVSSVVAGGPSSPLTYALGQIQGNQFVVTVPAANTVTQQTNKSTAVAVNGLSAVITTNNAALGAGTIVSFNWTNTSAFTTSAFIINHMSGGTLGAYSFNCRCSSNGTAVIDIRNNTAGSLSEALVLQVTIIQVSYSM